MTTVYWDKAPDEIVSEAAGLIEKFHKHLRDARIGFLFRSQASRSQGLIVLAKAQLVTARWKPLLKEELDFIIWIAENYWVEELTAKQRTALLDHELCHCAGEWGEWTMRGHDIEEFNQILSRHGEWHPALEEAGEALQLGLGLAGAGNGEALGKVTSVTLSSQNSSVTLT